MSIHSKVANTLYATQKYKNWAEVILAQAKGQEPEKLVLKNGLRIESPIGLRALVNEIFFWKLYNPANLTIGSNDIVIDIGANTGVFTVFAASITHNTVLAFEPFPDTFEVLQRNIAANNLQHVIASCAAMSGKVGFAKLFLNPHDSRQNLLTEHIFHENIEHFQASEDLNYLKSGIEQSKNYIEVPTTTLPAIMDRHQIEQIDFLKLDCEGSEGSILNSTPKEYLKRVRKIAMEFHDHLSLLNHNQIQKLLEETGFTTKLEWYDKSPHSPLGFLYGWRN